MADRTHWLYKPEYDEIIAAMVQENYSGYAINKKLKEDGCTLSFMTIYRRVRQFKQTMSKNNGNNGNE